MEILGYLGALFIGIILGITGGGGSILSVPVLVYILGYNPIIATAYSLFIVGTTSIVGALINFRKGLVVLSTALKFAAPSVIGVFLTRRFIVPKLPNTFGIPNYFTVSKADFLMLLFAIIMLLSAFYMLKNKKQENDTKSYNPKYDFLLLSQLFLVGILIGLIGSGGGFLIVPALLKFAKLPIKKAIGTSLLIIGINSLIGFIGDIQTQEIDWGFLFTFTTISILGIFIGLSIQKFINDKKLKKIFGIFIVLMAIFILYKVLMS